MTVSDNMVLHVDQCSSHALQPIVTVESIYPAISHVGILLAHTIYHLPWRDWEKLQYFPMDLASTTSLTPFSTASLLFSAPLSIAF